MALKGLLQGAAGVVVGWVLGALVTARKQAQEITTLRAIVNQNQQDNLRRMTEKRNQERDQAP